MSYPPPPGTEPVDVSAKQITWEDVRQRLAELGADVTEQNAEFMTGYLYSMIADQCNEIRQARAYGLQCPFFKLELIFNTEPETRQ